MDKLPFDDEDEDFMKEYDDENTNSKQKVLQLFQQFPQFPYRREKQLLKEILIDNFSPQIFKILPVYLEIEQMGNQLKQQITQKGEKVEQFVNEASGKLIKDSKFVAEKLLGEKIETAKQITQNIIDKKEKVTTAIYDIMEKTISSLPDKDILNRKLQEKDIRFPYYKQKQYIVDVANNINTKIEEQIQILNEKKETIKETFYKNYLNNQQKLVNQYKVNVKNLLEDNQQNFQNMQSKFQHYFRQKIANLEQYSKTQQQNAKEILENVEINLPKFPYTQQQNQLKKLFEEVGNHKIAFPYTPQKQAVKNFIKEITCSTIKLKNNQCFLDDYL